MRSLLSTVLPAELGPDFRKIWPASAISNLGDGAMLAAGPLLVASITDEPAAVGAAAFVQQLPWLLFALFSGALVDRLDRRLMIVAADTFRAAVIGLLGLAVLLHHAPLWAVYLTLFLLGTAETLADNAAGALLVTAVPKPQLGKANARLWATGTIFNQLGGPPIGALLFAIGSGVPLILDAITFAAAAALIARVASRPRTGSALRPPLWTGVREGIHWLWNHSGVRTLACAILVMNITFCAAFATWVLFARERLGLTDTQYGLLVSAGAIGAVAGMPVYHLLEPRVGSLTLLRAGLVIETTVHLVLALTRNPWVAGTTMAVFGVHAVVWGIVSTTARQLATPEALLGRVNSVYLLASVGGAALGALLGAVLAQRFGLVAPFLVAFVAMVAVTAVAWRPLRQVSVRSEAK
ncbi:MFS-type transporter involved in bile tolerance (Atg22 family) [Kribbella voronezhensis]|uniref:MFS-type transporter involved in bile tolerance (Atg22 family) n=1 Tax=Kribbella voronezhensis TaxID=2512212 RepID=A0A4R7TC30_9ACTN|nr:MFS transporter [Kribbella voronezhensis]TDU89624.1 MFS-type transporter involved in bile tolerance (Atg22 family) [Kribbella voronezhensis]